jgi:hypothetical protein
MISTCKKNAMRSILKQILIIMVLFFSANEIKSQEPLKEHKNFLGFSLSELIFTDFRFSFERRITPSHGVIAQFAYKPNVAEFTDATSISLGDDVTAWCYRNTAKWYFGSLGYRYYFNRKKTIYLSPEIFYKKMSADRIIYSYGNGDGTANTYQLRSMEAEMVGLNLLIGKKIRFKIDRDFHLGLDLFTGFTLRYKNIYTTTFGSTKASHDHDVNPSPFPIPISDTPLKESKKLGMIFLQFGVLLFCSW